MVILLEAGWFHSGGGTLQTASVRQQCAKAGAGRQRIDIADIYCTAIASGADHSVEHQLDALRDARYSISIARTIEGGFGSQEIAMTTFNPPMDITWQEVGWLIRATVDHTRGGPRRGKGEYQGHYFSALAMLQKDGHCEHVKPDESFEDFIQAQVRQPALRLRDQNLQQFMRLALNKYFMELVPPEEHATVLQWAREMMEENRRRPAQRAGNGNGGAVDNDDPVQALYQRLVFGHDKETAKLAGQYLILRRTFSIRPNRLIVSLMTIEQPVGAGRPAMFFTEGAKARRTMFDNRFVEGFIYASPSPESGFNYYSHGYVTSGDGGEIVDPNARSTILWPVARPDGEGTLGNSTGDLIGVRLGLGRVHGRPRGYRIWCCRLATPLTDEGAIGEFLLQNAVNPLSEYPALSRIADRSATRDEPADARRRIEHEFQSAYTLRRSPVSLPVDVEQRLVGIIGDGLKHIITWLSVKSYADISTTSDPIWHVR